MLCAVLGSGPFSQEEPARVSTRAGSISLSTPTSCSVSPRRSRSCSRCDRGAEPCGFRQGSRVESKGGQSRGLLHLPRRNPPTPTGCPAPETNISRETEAMTGRFALACERCSELECYIRVVVVVEQRFPKQGGMVFDRNRHFTPSHCEQRESEAPAGVASCGGFECDRTSADTSGQALTRFS